MIVYPKSGYNSFISTDYADTYFETRLHSAEWDAADKEQALMTAYRSLQELDIVIDVTDDTALTAIKYAQCEQALHEIRHDVDGERIQAVNIAGLLSVGIDTKKHPQRFSERALNILRPYLSLKAVNRIR